MEPTIELEAAIADAGMLLVQAEKYRFPDPAAPAALRQRLLRLGDRSRRLSRTGALDGGMATRLASEVREATAELARLLDALRASPPYRAAVAALRTGSAVDLAGHYASVFADLTLGPPPAAAFLALSWQRRGRPLDAPAVADAIAAARDTGVAAEADESTAGTDDALPGVLLSRGWPPGSPIALRYARDVLPPATAWLGADEIVLPGARLALPFTVALAPPTEALDEWLADPQAYRRALRDACAARGLAIVELVPAASS